MKNKINLRNSRILVAGGTGFLGKRVIKKLKNKNLDFVSASLSQGVDFRDKKQTEKIFNKEKPDIVINCATFIGGIKFGLDHEGEIFYNNTLMSTNLIETSRKFNVKRFINPISNCSYPDVVQKDFKEQEWWDGPLHPTVLGYGLIRKASWVQLRAYLNQYGFESLSFLIPNMYGPDDHFDEVRSHALGALIKKIVKAKEENLPEVIIWGSGKPVREWLFVDDCVEIFMRSFDIETSIEPINIGQGIGVSIRELVDIITKIVKYKGKFIYDTSRPDGAPYKIMNVDRLKKTFNWMPATSLEKGIKLTIDWYYKNMFRK